VTTALAPRRTRLDRDERREQILSRARGLFSERTYAAVSMDEIARAAGVARGLLHHYFGTKRELYLEVVRGLVRLPPPPLPQAGAGRSLDEAVAESVDLWLDLVALNRGTWLAAVGAEGFGRDPELERILDEARELTTDRVIEVLGMAGDPPPELRGLIRSYGGLAEAAVREWLERSSLTREQVSLMLTDTLLRLARAVLPRVEALR
jgi:AcrR family transcriptional regulator